MEASAAYADAMRRDDHSNHGATHSGRIACSASSRVTTLTEAHVDHRVTRGCRKLLHFDALAGLSSLRDLAMPAASQDKDIAEVLTLTLKLILLEMPHEFHRHSDTQAKLPSNFPVLGR